SDGASIMAWLRPAMAMASPGLGEVPRHAEDDAAVHASVGSKRSILGFSSRGGIDRGNARRLIPPRLPHRLLASAIGLVSVPTGPSWRHGGSLGPSLRPHGASVL